MSIPTVAISGCGAVTELYQAPAIGRLSDEGALRVVGVYDPSPASRDTVASRFTEARPVTDYDGLLELRPDLVVVASPPVHHREQVVTALSHGVHVLCEKPLAIRGTDAREMVAAARAHGKVLAVGMVRRYLAAARTIMRFLADGALGEVHRFDLFEGGPFRWAFRSSEYFARDTSGGGVLADIGPHVIDLLAWWFGPIGDTVAADDAMGGVEANAFLEVRCRDARGRVRLSRDWLRPNRVEIEGTGGRLEWDLDEGDRLVIERSGGQQTPQVGSGAVTFEECFVLQLQDVLDAIAVGKARLVNHDHAVHVVEVIEEAYRRSTLLEMPWLGEHERSVAARLRAG